MAHFPRVQQGTWRQRGGAPGRDLALPGPAGEFAKQPRPAARWAKRRSLRRVPALPAPGPDRTRAGPATGDKLKPVNVPPNSPVNAPLTRVRGRVRGRVGGRRGETRPLNGGENQDGPEKSSRDAAPSWRSARRTRFDGFNQPVSLRNCVVWWGQAEGDETRNGRGRFTPRDGLTERRRPCTP